MYGRASIRTAGCGHALASIVKNTKLHDTCLHLYETSKISQLDSSTSTWTSSVHTHHPEDTGTASLSSTGTHASPRLFRSKTSALNASQERCSQAGSLATVFNSGSPSIKADISKQSFSMLSHVFWVPNTLEPQHITLQRTDSSNGYTDYDVIPTFLMGIRAAWKDDMQATPAELVFGESIRLPGEFPAPSGNMDTPPANLVERLRTHFRDLQPQPMSCHGSRPTFIFKDLTTCSHVLVRVDAPRYAFDPPYKGPYPVVADRDRFYILRITDTETAFSIDRLKPIYVLREDDLDNVSHRHHLQNRHKRVLDRQGDRYTRIINLRTIQTRIHLHRPHLHQRRKFESKQCYKLFFSTLYTSLFQPGE